MICVQNPISLECKRVEDAEAHKLVNQYRWRYISKSVYKSWQVMKMEMERA